MVIDVLIAKLQDKIQKYLGDYGRFPSVIILENSYKFTELVEFQGIPIYYTHISTDVKVF